MADKPESNAAGAGNALLTVPEVAALLKVSVKTIRRRIKTGTLPAIRLGKGKNPPIRVSRGALDQWLRAYEEFANLEPHTRPPTRRSVASASRSHDE